MGLAKQLFKPTPPKVMPIPEPIKTEIMSLPAKYSFIESIGLALPRLLQVALQYIGVREYPGKSNYNPVIKQMAKTYGVDDIYKDDDTSWCAVFIGYCMVLADKPIPDTKGDKYNKLRAKWWANWGEPVPLDEIMFGDLLIFERPGGGHVAFYIAETPDGKNIHCLGGNQGNKVGIDEISRSRLIGARRLYRTGIPPSVKKYFLTSSGILSTNEA